MKLQLCLLMVLLGVMFVQGARLMQEMEDIPEEEQDVPEEEQDVPEKRSNYGTCDWPRGYCVYKYDPCSPGMVACHHAYSCSLYTNKCCCWPSYGRR